MEWAEAEFGGAVLGDLRLTKRLVQLARQRGAKMQASIAESCGGPSGSRAAYRFYDNPQVNMEAIQIPHRATTVERMRGEAVVLAVQDTTQVDLTRHAHTAGLGYLQDLAHRGYLVHSTMMVTPQRVPLGLIQQQVWVRDEAEYGKRQKRHERPMVEKESQKWLTSLEAAAAVQRELPETRVVSVGDSEADIFALFAASLEKGVSFLVRAWQDRLIEDADERHLWKHLEALPVAGTREVILPRQDQRPARSVVLTVRFAQVALKVPVREKKHQEHQSVTAWAILAREEQPPAGEEAIEWKLLTNVPTETPAQAHERIDWYSCRWVVEMFHRVLKSGCRLEERQFDDLDNIQRFLALDSVVAWRVLYLTLCTRQLPELPCDALFETYEWQALYCFVHKTNQPPEQVPLLSDAVIWLARLGGFTASRKRQPGTTVLWRGLSRLTDIALAWRTFHPDP